MLPELARHASIAAPLGGATEAVDYTTRAAARAERSLGLGEAATHYRRALQVAAAIEEPRADLILALTTKLGEVLNGLGDPQSRELLRRAATMAREAEDPRALAEVALAMIRYGGVPVYGAPRSVFQKMDDAVSSPDPAGRIA